MSRNERILFMNISKRQWLQVNKKIAGLERRIQNQQLMIELLFQFCRSVANKEKHCLISYQQLYSPSADSAKEVRILFEQLRKFR